MWNLHISDENDRILVANNLILDANNRMTLLARSVINLTSNNLYIAYKSLKRGHWNFFYFKRFFLYMVALFGWKLGITLPPNFASNDVYITYIGPRMWGVHILDENDRILDENDRILNENNRLTLPSRSVINFTPNDLYIAYKIVKMCKLEKFYFIRFFCISHPFLMKMTNMTYILPIKALKCGTYTFYMKMTAFWMQITR
jgi:hypothetical protein